MNNIDDWLNSLTVPTEEDTPNTQTLTDNDFNDILSSVGFQEPSFDEAEEVQEEPQEEVRDLDTEEDADWQEAIDSGGISVVPRLEPIVEVDADGREYIYNSVGQRVYLHSEVVDAINSNSDRTASNILEANMEIIRQEAPSTPEEAMSYPEREPLISSNSPTLLIDDTNARFSGAEWFNEIQKKNIIIAGIGGIGSWLALQVARMHPSSIHLYDDDDVERVNMSGQLYSYTDVGKAKVDAVACMIMNYTNEQHIYAHRKKFLAGGSTSDIMMCGFDNMKARKDFFNTWLQHVNAMPEEDKKKCLFLDGRLSIDTLQVFCITGDDTYNINRYADKYLFSDEEADETICSMKQTTYLACMIGSFMTNLFTNFCANLLDPVIPYDLPFFTEYDAQNMIFKTEK